MKPVFIEHCTKIYLKDVSKIDGTVCKDLQFQNYVQRVFAHSAFGPTSIKQFSIELVEGDKQQYYFAEILLLLHIGTTEVKDNQQEFFFVDYYEITAPLDKIDEVLICICLKRATDNETDHSSHFDSSQCDRIEVGEWETPVFFQL